jgi:hypothetical protein
MMTEPAFISQYNLLICPNLSTADASKENVIMLKNGLTLSITFLLECHILFLSLLHGLLDTCIIVHSSGRKLLCICVASACYSDQPNSKLSSEAAYLLVLCISYSYHATSM